MILADTHTHSTNSPDGESTVSELCRAAEEKSFSVLAVTDHCEMDFFERDDCARLIKSSYVDCREARKSLPGSRKLLFGIELSGITHAPALARSVLSQYPFDFVLASLHNLSGEEDFYFLDCGKYGAANLMDRYFDELLKLARGGDFDSLAHMTYPLRYLNGREGLGIDIRDYRERLIPVFQALIERNKALEINTSGLRQAYGLTMPDLWCLSLYRRTGGKLITIGSDAHRAADLGAGIVEGVQMARQAGFERYCVFEGRKPVFFSLADEKAR